MHAQGVKVFLVCGCVFLGGCATNTHGPLFKTSQASRNTTAARDANERGLALVAREKLKEAEEAFREAIGHDARFAPAHNNLGLVMLQAGKLPEAATELRTASKLDAHAAEPAHNLTLLYKHLGL